MRKNYFESARTAEDVKALYKQLVKELHPDCNLERDTTAEFQEMQRQYYAAWERLKNIHVNKDGERYETQKDNTQNAKEFADIIDKLARYNGISIELCGSWIWVTGDTKPIKDELKALKFRFSPKKTAWYFHSEPYKKTTKKSFNLDEIRNMYGSEQLNGKTRLTGSYNGTMATQVALA